MNAKPTKYNLLHAYERQTNEIQFISATHRLLTNLYIETGENISTMIILVY